MSVKQNFIKNIWKNRMIYSLLLPGLIWYIIFAYGPMGGLTLAFKTYKASKGIWGSPGAVLKTMFMFSVTRLFFPLYGKLFI